MAMIHLHYGKETKFLRNPSMSTADLQQKITRIYDHLYANAPIRTPSGIATEVGKILHAAMFIEENRPSLLMEQEYNRVSAFTFNRSQLDRLMRCDSSLCAQVAKKVRSAFSDMNRTWHLYEPEAKIQLSDSDVAYTCSQLSGVIVSDPNRDVFGDALETFRGQWAKRVGGQFFTDQRVTSLAITLLDYDPRKGDDLVDICAGTGGFLLAGLNHIRTLMESENGRASLETELVEIASASLKGQEVDREVGEIANATLTSRLSVVHRPFVSIGDSLRPDAFATSNESGIFYDSHLCAATNPPFGSKITVKDMSVLKSYDLARTAYSNGSSGNAEKVTSRAPEILFIEQNVRILKPGLGRLAIVVPYQVLSGPQTFYIREWLLRHTEIIAVIDLPADTFQPHTGTKGALLVVKRRVTPLSDLREAEDKPVFMSMPRWIGHDRRGNPIYKRTSDGKISDEVLCDFDSVKEAFHLFRDGRNPQDAHPGSFKIALSDILKDSNLRMNARFHKPSQHALQGSIPALKEHGKSYHRVKVGDVVRRIFYPTRFKRDYVDYYPGAIPFLGGSNISQLTVIADKWLRHDDPKVEELKVHAGWLLVTRSGTTGIVATVPRAWDGFAMSEHVIRIVPDPQKLDPAYLHAFLRTKYAQEILSRGVFGSVIDEITPEYISEMEIPVPQSDELLRIIVDKVNCAENARQVAIDSLLESVGMLNTWLTAPEVIEANGDASQFDPSS